MYMIGSDRLKNVWNKGRKTTKRKISQANTQVWRRKFDGMGLYRMELSEFPFEMKGRINAQ
jgi:hypothetical protein